MKNPKPSDHADYFALWRDLARSVLDATNLVNLRWLLYEEARRKAWFEQQQADAATGRRPVAAPRAPRTSERRMKTRRRADRGLPPSGFTGKNHRRGNDRRAPDRAA